MNKVILHRLQKKLDDAKGKWADELHGVLWYLRTMEKWLRVHFMPTYGSEVVVPIEVDLLTHCLTTF